MEYSLIFSIILVGFIGSFAFILITSILFNRFVLHNQVFDDHITGLLYCLIGGIVSLFLYWGETPVLPAGYIWIALKGFTWTGFFGGLVDIISSRREARDRRDLITEVNVTDGVEG